MSNKSKIEICANSVESAVKAQQAGAYRVELCAGIPEGGTTPSFGEIRMARQLLNQTKLHVIIRPRGGDFLYSPIEQEIMLHDIKVARQLGADGVVFGCLTAEGYVVVTPADALVINTDEFRRVIAKALLMTDQSKAIVTIGIRPCRPETGYGYIAAGEEVDQDIRKVDEFKEKPDLKTARHYVDAGNYFWNAGIFVWNVKTIEEAIRRYAPGIAEVFDRIYPEFYTEREKETIEELFPACESISIDYAVMEKAERIYVLPAEFGWSDLGSWGSLHSLLPKDERNNAVVGENVRMYECNNCIVHTPHLKQAVIQGLDGYIIAEKEGTLLICRLAEEQRIKEFSKA